MNERRWSGKAISFQILMLLIPLLLFTGCKKKECNPVALVNEADELISAGGLEVADQRQKIYALYNKALTCGGKLTDEENELVQSHSHFGIAMVNIFDSLSLINTLLGGMGGEGGCGTSCAGGGGCAGCGAAGSPSCAAGTSCAGCSDSCDSCNISNLQAGLRTNLFLAGFLNGVIYLSPLIFLFLFRMRRSIRRRRMDIPAILLVAVFLSSIFLAGLKPKQTDGECQPLELGELTKFLSDAMDQILGPIINDLTEVKKYKSFSMNLTSAKLTILSDNPFTTDNTEDPLYIDLKGTYDYADVSFILGAFQGVLGLVKVVFAYDVVDPLLAFLTAPDCAPNPLTVPGFGDAVASMSELAGIRQMLASSVGSIRDAFNYVISERLDQAQHLLNYTDTGIDARDDKDEFAYDEGNSNPNPAGDTTEGDGTRQPEEAGIQLVSVPATFPLPAGTSKTQRIFTGITSSPVIINNVLPVGETFYDYGADGKAHTYDRDKNYQIHNTDGTGDGTGGPFCKMTNWCFTVNPLAICLPVCSTEANGFYENSAGCGGKPGEPFSDKGTDGQWDNEESGRFGLDGKPGDLGVDDDGNGIIDDASEWCPGWSSACPHPAVTPYGDDSCDPAGDNGVTECNEVYDWTSFVDTGIDSKWDIEESGRFGTDGKPGVANTDDDGNGIIDDASEWCPGWTYACPHGGVPFGDDSCDPTGDNWDAANPSGTECNSIYNPGEALQGEPFSDVGCDGVQGEAPDFSEGDGMWVLGIPGEPFNDYGIDGIPGTYDYGEGDSYFRPFMLGIEISGMQVAMPFLPAFVISEGANYYDSDGILHIVQTQNWADVGIDGKPDVAEQGYDSICNPDPAGDNYSAKNRSGTEGNNIYDIGEPFLDWGTDVIYQSGWTIGVPDLAEAGFAKSDPAGDNLSYSNPNGTENNGKYDPGERWDFSLTGYLFYILLQALPSLGIDISSLLPLPIDISVLPIDEAAPIINDLVSPIISKAIYLNETTQFLKAIEQSIMDDSGSTPANLVPLITALLKKLPGLLTEIGNLGVDVSSIAEFSAIVGLVANMPEGLLYNIPSLLADLELLLGFSLPEIPGIPSIDMGALFRNPATNITDILPMFHKTDEPSNGDCSTLEPFADINGNGIRDAFEYYIDTNGNGAYDPPQCTFTDIDGNALWNRAGDFMSQTTEIEAWYDVGDPLITKDPAEGNGKFDPGEPFYDWGIDQLPDLYEAVAWGPDGRPGKAFWDDDGDSWTNPWGACVYQPDPLEPNYDPNCDEPDEYLYGYDSNSSIYGSGSNDDRIYLKSELGPDGKPGKAGFDDNCNDIIDDYGEYLNKTGTFGLDDKPGVATGDDDFNGNTDDISEFCYCRERKGTLSDCGSDDTYSDSDDIFPNIIPPFGPDGAPGVAYVDDNNDGYVDNLAEYVYCQHFLCPLSDDNPDPAGDNYNYYTNPGGTELNGIYDIGEKYDDYGLNGERDDPEEKDDGEDNGVFDAGDPFSNVGIDNRHDSLESAFNPVLTPDPGLDNMDCVPALCSYIFTSDFDTRTERSILISALFYPGDPTVSVIADNVFKYTYAPVREAAALADPKWKNAPDTDPRKNMQDFPHYWPLTGQRDDANNVTDPMYLFFTSPVLGGLLTIPAYHNGPITYCLAIDPSTGDCVLPTEPERNLECGSITYNASFDNITLNSLISLISLIASGEISLEF